jgi:hypothetical protein
MAYAADCRPCVAEVEGPIRREDTEVDANQGSDAHSQSDRRQPRTIRLWLAAVLAGVALAVGVASGSAAGYATQQPVVAASRAQAIRADQAARTAQDVYQAKAQRLDAQATALDARQADLDRRQKELDARTAALNATSFSDGIYQVGRDVQPGIYRETQPAGTCYYAKLHSSTTSDIIDNANVNGPATVTLDGSVAFFQTARCGTWTKIG